MKIEYIGEVTNVSRRQVYSGDYTKPAEHRTESTITFKNRDSQYGGSVSVEGDYRIGTRFRLWLEDTPIDEA